MSGYEIAWVVVGVAGVLCIAATGMLLRHSVRSFLLFPALALLAALLFVPAPHPGAEGVWAPAFLVALFEGLFQLDGHPTTALRLLLAGCITALVVSGGVSGLLALRKSRLRKSRRERSDSP